MSEVQEAAKPAPKIVSAGKPEKVNFNIPLASQAAENTDTGTGGGKSQEEIDKEIAAAKLIEGAAETPEAKAIIEAKELKDNNKLAAEPPKPLTDEEIKAEYEKRFPTTPEKTAEEKLADEKLFKKRMLDLFVENGGTAEVFVSAEQIAAADLTEFTKSELTKELKKAGFSDFEIIEFQNERLTQLSDEELQQFPDETKKEFEKRKREYDKKQIEGRFANTKAQAVEFFNTLKSALTEQDLQVTKKSDAEKLQATKESEFSSNVEEHFNKVERKMTLQLGKVDDTDIAPVEFEVPESIISEAKDVLKDAAKRKQLLYNDDGSLNLGNIAELILKGKMFDSAAKTSYLEGGSREVAKFEKIFPIRNTQAIGVGGGNGANKGVKGKIVSAGKPQRFNPAVAQ